jgi:hypothetical protein
LGCEITNRSFKEITSSGNETGYPSEAVEFILVIKFENYAIVFKKKIAEIVTRKV